MGTFRSIITGCPAHCDCKGMTIECYQFLPKFIPKDVTKVKVKEADFGEVFDFTGHNWGNITFLSITNMSRNEHHLHSRTLQENEFIQLIALEHLKLECLCLESIHKNAFNGLNNLKALDLSENGKLGFEEFVNGTMGPGVLLNLEELYLSHIAFLNMKPYKIKTDFYDFVKNKPLKVLDISANPGILLQREGIFEALPHLESFNISGCGYAGEIFLHTQTTRRLGFDRLKVFDISYPSAPMHVLGELSTSEPAISDPPLSLPLSLSEIYAKNLWISPSKLHGTSNSTSFCFRLPADGINFQSCCCWTGNGMALNKLVLSENSILYFDPRLFHFFGNIQYIDVSKNLLGDAISKGNLLRDYLDILKNLEIFIASDNGIKQMPKDSFRSSKSLRFLDLSNNKLNAIAFDTAALVSLEKLDISHNKITFLDSNDLSKLNFLLRDVKPVKAIITGNPFICSCESVQFLRWLTNFKDNYTCTLDSEEKDVDHATIRSAEYLCVENIVIAVSVLIAVICNVIAAFIVYGFMRRKRQLKKEKQLRMGVEMYDVRRKLPPVFLSFCSEDDEVIVNEILPKLNAGLKEILNTDSDCVSTGMTHFQPGLSVANEIIRCIEAASVVVFFVTNAFCKKMWCRNETLVAINENKPTILMLWEEVDLKLMPKHLYKHFQLYARARWVLKDGQRIMMPGWKELCETIVRLFRRDEALQ